MSRWFRQYLPVVVDLETGGVDAMKNPILEIACVALDWQNGIVTTGDHYHAHVTPYAGSVCAPKSLEITGIIPDHPFRFAIDEDVMLSELSEWLIPLRKRYRCHTAMLVGHNAHFDLGFLNQAYGRYPSTAGTFHRFSVLDTVSLGMAMYGETVLARVAKKSGVPYDESQAHSALYDAQLTADVFCQMINASGHMRKKATI